MSLYSMQEMFTKEALSQYWQGIACQVIGRQEATIKQWPFIYKMSPEGKSTLMSDAFGVMVEFLFWKRMSESELEEYMTYVLKFQDPETGFFICKELHNNARDELYIKWQTTYFVLKVMSMYGQQPQYPLKFLTPFAEHTYVVQWLENLDWNDSWLVSNNVMFLMFFLECHGSVLPDSQVIIERIFQWLNYFQDPITWFFGNNCSSYLLGSMCGSYHIYPSYMHHWKKIHHVEKIIDNTLSLQNSDGCFYYVKWCGACPDYDWVDILAKLTLLTDYRREDIVNALQKALRFLMWNQLPNGAFCEAKRDPDELKDVSRFPSLLQPWLLTKEFKYSWYEAMKYNIEDWDVRSNLIRPYTIAIILWTLYKIEWFGYDATPAHLWHPMDEIIAKNKTLYL